jgi:hypothetical protein
LGQKKLSRNDAVGLGGTANLAVLGGNLPPSLGAQNDSPVSVPRRLQTGGLVARQNGPVAHSTQTSTAWFRLKENTAHLIDATTRSV